MEIKALVQELTETEIIAQSEDKEIIRLPKRLAPWAAVGKEIYVNLEEEPSRRPRELLNEILGS